jgi:hypothetical protein
MEHLNAARETAQETYDRRRARAAADILATIPPARWDAMTRNVIALLAGRRPIPVRPHVEQTGPHAVVDLSIEETIYEDAQGFTSCHSGVCGACDACRTGPDDPLNRPPR